MQLICLLRYKVEKFVTVQLFSDMPVQNCITVYFLFKIMTKVGTVHIICLKIRNEIKLQVKIKMCIIINTKQNSCNRYCH